MVEKDVILSVQEIEPGKADRLREWFSRDDRDGEQAKESLRNEGIWAESAFIYSMDDTEYLLYYIEADDFEHAMEEFSRSDYGNIKRYKEIIDDVMVGGLDQYHSDRAEELFHIVVDDQER